MSENTDIVQVTPVNGDDGALSSDRRIAEYHGASLLILTDQEEKALLAPFDEQIVEIREFDGLIYVPQVFVRERLNKVLGVGQWALVQHGVSRDKANLYFDGSLIIRGNFAARAVGEAKYIDTNPRDSWAGAYEKAKSDCITRCCKDLGIAADLWRPQYAKTWRARYAEQRGSKWYRKSAQNAPQMRHQDSPGYTEEAEGVLEPNKEYLALAATIKAVPLAEAEAAWQPIAVRLKTKADIGKITNLTHPEAQALAIEPLRELVNAIAEEQ